MSDPTPDPETIASERRRKRKLFTLNLFAWVVTVAVAVFFFLRMQEGRDEKERIHREPQLQVCMGNLARIGIALKRYAELHNGAYPETLRVLVNEKLLPDEDALKCPEKGMDYIYLYDRSLPLPCSASMPIVIDKLGSHPDRTNVLYADYQVRNEPVMKKGYTRIALRKKSCTKKEQKYLDKQLRELDKIFFIDSAAAK